MRTGISDPAVVETYPFRPDEMLESVAELVDAAPVASELDAPRADVCSGVLRGSRLTRSAHRQMRADAAGRRALRPLRADG